MKAFDIVSSKKIPSHDFRQKILQIAKNNFLLYAYA